MYECIFRPDQERVGWDQLFSLSVSLSPPVCSPSLDVALGGFVPVVFAPVCTPSKSWADVGANFPAFRGNRLLPFNLSQCENKTMFLMRGLGFKNRRKDRGKWLDGRKTSVLLS